jgi:hypothetical protein
MRVAPLFPLPFPLIAVAAQVSAAGPIPPGVPLAFRADNHPELPFSIAAQ